MIKICETHCKSEWQDKMHGKGKRVLNEMRSMGGGQKGRCTVCGKEMAVEKKGK